MIPFQYIEIKNIKIKLFLKHKITAVVSLCQSSKAFLYFTHKIFIAFSQIPKLK